MSKKLESKAESYLMSPGPGTYDSLSGHLKTKESVKSMKFGTGERSSMENIQTINFQQEFKLKNTDESFERQKNEAILIDDFISSSINELFLQISNM